MKIINKKDQTKRKWSAWLSQEALSSKTRNSMTKNGSGSTIEKRKFSIASKLSNSRSPYVKLSPVLLHQTVPEWWVWASSAQMTPLSLATKLWRRAKAIERLSGAALKPPTTFGTTRSNEVEANSLKGQILCFWQLTKIVKSSKV